MSTSADQFTACLLGEALPNQHNHYVASHRRQVIAAVDTWWDKYRVAIRDIEAKRDGAATRLAGLVAQQGYST